MNNPTTAEEKRNHRLQEAIPYYLYQPADIENTPPRIDKLTSDKIWISDPAKFNDPLDINIKIKDITNQGPFGKNEGLASAMQILLDKNPTAGTYWFFTEHVLEKLCQWIKSPSSHNKIVLISTINQRFKEFGVACFTPMINNNLMWAHYASGHKGFCIEYTVKELELIIGNEANFAAYDVEYASVLPDLCISEALFSPHQTLRRMLATKHLDWAYEKEWRLIHLKEKGTLVTMPQGIEISALIAGISAAEDLKVKIRNKAKELEIPAFCMKKVTYSYENEMELL